MKTRLVGNPHLEPWRSGRTFRGVTAMFAAKLRVCFGGTFVSLCLGAPLVLPAVPVPAQEADASRPAHRTITPYKHPSLDGQVERLSRYLDLDEAQRSTLKNILQQRQEEILLMRLTPPSDGTVQIDRVRAIEDKTAERIRASLNEEQRKKHDLLSVRRTAPAPDQRSLEDWLKVTRPK